MGAKRFIAFFMHESEAGAAASLMKNATATDSFMIGEVEDVDIEKMEKAGLKLQPLDEPTPHPIRKREPFTATRAKAAGLPTAGVAVTAGIGGTAGARVPAPVPPPLSMPSAPPPLDKPNYYRVYLAGPLIEPWRTALQATGAKIVESLHDFGMTIRIAPADIEKVRRLPFISSAELHDEEDSLPRAADVERLRTEDRTGVRAYIPYDLILREADSLPTVLTWLKQHNIDVAGKGVKKIRIYLLEDSDLLEQITAMPEIDRADPYVPPRLHNDQARILLGVDGNPGHVLPLEGDGQIVGIADTGIDENHPDFTNRIVKAVPLGRPGNATDTHGHGTHVAGSVLGDGNASQGLFRGTAPKAKLFFQSLLDSQGGLGGLPFQLQDLFDEAYRAEVRVHNNSWGSATASFYRINSEEVDDFVYSHKDMVVVISAGNEGTEHDPPEGTRNAATGFVDWLSIGSPATAKNALCVGASQNNRNTGGYAAFKYGDAWPDQFTHAPIKDELVSGNPDSMAAFSSRGPCNDYRIKPDIVAPGTDIISCKSSMAPLRHFWGPHANAQYAYMGGTSMAAPLVTGCAALIREYYMKLNPSHAPSAALVRATLINGARWLPGASAAADFNMPPNYHQGFGRVDVANSVPAAPGSAFRLLFFDNWQDPATALFQYTGQRFRFQFRTDGSQPLRICMAYTDVPGRALQNDLNLFLQDPTGKKWMGNEQLPNGLHRPDPTNNVEIIRIQNPPAGDYLIQITATNLLRPPQDVALVVTGAFTTDLVRI